MCLGKGANDNETAYFKDRLTQLNNKKYTVTEDQVLKNNKISKTNFNNKKLANYLDKDKFRQEDDFGFPNSYEFSINAINNNEISGIYNNSEFKIVKSLNSEPFMITINSFNLQKHTFYFEKSKMQKFLNIQTLDELYNESILKL